MKELNHIRQALQEVIYNLEMEADILEHKEDIKGFKNVLCERLNELIQIETNLWFIEIDKRIEEK